MADKIISTYLSEISCIELDKIKASWPTKISRSALASYLLTQCLKAVRSRESQE